MSRIHEERKDFYSSREGVLTSTSNIRNISSTLSQNMEKDKVEKPLFGQTAFVKDSGFRTVDLIKQPIGRNIVPASLGASATQLHAMPHLVTNYMTVPINQGIVRGQPAFQAHIPVGLGTATAIAPPRASVNSQRLPTLKPTNIPNQIQLPLSQLPLLPPNPSTSNRTGSPTVTTHALSSDSRLDSRSARINDHHNVLRGNVQASHNTTIQVIASGTAAQTHIPTSILSKTSSFSPNLLKIGASTHSSTLAGTAIPASPFKLGIGKAFTGSSSVIIPSSTNPPKIETSFNRFSTSHNIAIPSHHISSLSITTTISGSQALTVTTTSTDSRANTAVGVPYQPITGAYVLHDIGGMHNFSHQLVRPPQTTGPVSIFTVDSQHGIPTVPVVSIAAVTKGPIIATESSNPPRSANASFSIQNLYPNIQTNNSSASSSTSSVESSVRPSILRKRPAETTLFPVQPTEKERNSSPVKIERNNTILSTRILSPNLLSNEKLEPPKIINHSIQSITSSLPKPPTPLVSEMPTTTSTFTSSNSQIMSTAPTTMPLLISNSVQQSSASTNGLPEASPKKKPRKQLIITTEDKYGTNPVSATGGTDEDEEFLKSNETMKDLTPPKLTPANSSSVPSNSSAIKQLYTSPPVLLKGELKQDNKVEVKTESGEITPRNGLITGTSAESKTTDAVKYILFRRKPQFSIINNCKINTKAAHNHFYRCSDVRVKDEKKGSAQDRLLTKSSVESATGWRIHHLSTQFDDLVALENSICEGLLKCKEIVPQPNLSSPTSHYRTDAKISEEDTQLRLLHELIQGSVQRCRCSIEQLEEAKTNMFKLLEHRPKALDMLKKYKQKLNSKKKVSS